MSVDYEDAKADWERDVMLPLIAELKEAIDNETKWTVKKEKVIKKMVELCESTSIVETHEISQYLKKLFRRSDIDISDDTIERACGEGKKKKYKTLPRTSKPAMRISEHEELDKKVIEQTTTGQSRTRPYRPDRDVDPAVLEEMDRDREELPNALAGPGPCEDFNQTIKELEDKRERDHETIKAMQKHIDDLQNERHRLERLASDAETSRKATQQDFDKLKVRTDELEEALAKSIKKDGFTTASSIPTKMPQANEQLWIPAIEALKLFVPLRNARDTAVDNHQPWRKVLFEWEANSGKITGARLADA